MLIRDKYSFAAALFLAGFLFLFFTRPAGAAGAHLSIAPSNLRTAVGKDFVVLIKLNSGSAVINAAEGALKFDPDRLEITRIETRGSLFSLWVTEPEFDNKAGTLRFGGGLPRPGWQGSSGMILGIGFRAKAAGLASVSFTEGAALANDGQGSNILESLGSASFRVLPAEMENPSNIKGKITPEKNKPEAETASIPSFSSAVFGISSPTHPDNETWYATSSAVFTWELPEKAEAVSWLLDDEPETDPGPQNKAPVESIKLENIEDGLWYFHLKARVGGRWTETESYSIKVDTTPPLPFSVEIKQEDLEDWPFLKFLTVDPGSGIMQYEVNIGSLEEKGLVMSPGLAELKTSNLTAGEHTAIVKAVDRAGNATYSTVKFIIKPLPAPEITYLPREIRTNEVLLVNGTAGKDLFVTVYIRNQDGRVATSTARTNEDGSWQAYYSNRLAYGRFTVWATARNKNGIPSNPSAKLSFAVTPSAFVRIGSFVINYFALVAVLLLVVAFSSFLIIMAVFYIRRMLKKETFEIEDVLRENMESLSLSVKQEFKELARKEREGDPRAERLRMKLRITDKIEATNKKILKEIKDVEGILK
jgi:hypothetical protein